MVNIRFYGALKQFGTQFELDVKDTAEAVRALISQIPKLRQHLQQGYYKVRIGKDYLTTEALEQGLFYRLKKGMTIHFTPVVAGAKKAGVFQVVLGAALIGASFFIPGAGLLGGMITKGMVAGLGASMMLGGVAQMLTKMPSMHTGNSVEKKQSTAFGNIQNMVSQGQPVPLAYGQIRCGSMIISQGVETFDVETEQAKPNKQQKGFRKG